MSVFLNIEILHTLPFSNANRDDAGLPKSTITGGVQRGRLSSQSLKHAARYYAADVNKETVGNNPLAKFARTRFVHKMISEELTRRSAPDFAHDRVQQLFHEKSPLGKLEKGRGKDDETRQNSLVVVTPTEIQQLADLIMDATVETITPKDIEGILANSSKRDLALWGRFFASSDDASFEGAAQVAHAFTTHSVDIESDFLVGVDEAQHRFSSNRGAGFTGENFYHNGTFYKYANINITDAATTLMGAKNKEGIITRLRDNTTTEIVQKDLTAIIEDFITSFTLSVPSGRIHSTAHNTLPDLVRISVYEDRPVSGASAFDIPVKPTDNTSIVQESVKALAETHEDATMFVGEPVLSKVLCTRTVAPYATSLGEKVTTMNALVHSVDDTISRVVHDVFKVQGNS